VADAPPSPFLPTPAQESFLDLLLCSKSPVEIHIRSELLRDVKCGQVGPDLNPLFPLLLSRLGNSLPAELADYARELHQYIAFQNRLLMARLAEAVHELENAGIRTAILKGSALIAEYYRDPGLRFMRDGDLLVDRDAVAPALEKLSQQGWKWKWPQKLTPFILRTQHSIDMTHENGTRLDLHWTPINAVWHPGTAGNFWEASHTCDLCGVKTRAFCAADQLFHICIHGACYTEPRDFRWIVDVATILGTTPGLDWNRLVEQSRARAFSLWTGITLDYLLRRFKLAIPREVVELLLAEKSSDFMRADFRGLTHPRNASSGWQRGHLVWLRYRALAPGRSTLRRALEFPAYLRHDMRANTFGDLLVRLVKGRMK
jgi:hypothetical protein